MVQQCLQEWAHWSEQTSMLQKVTFLAVHWAPSRRYCVTTCYSVVSIVSQSSIHFLHLSVLHQRVRKHQAGIFSRFIFSWLRKHFHPSTELNTQFTQNTPSNQSTNQTPHVSSETAAHGVTIMSGCITVLFPALFYH